MTRKRLIILGSVLLLLTVAVVVITRIINQFSQPVQGTTKVGQGTVDNQNISFSVSLTPKPQSNHYATFDYPSGITLNTPQPLTAPFVATMVYSARDVESWVLAIDISSNPVGNLSNNSAYLGRIDNPTEYHQSQTTINGQPVLIITDTTAPGFSQLAFLVHGSWLATVALTGDDANGTQPLQTAFNMVLNSWHWHV
jgi:hypothetical protein